MTTKSVLAGLTSANWDDPSVWSPGGVPLLSDTVVIHNANVTINGNDTIQIATYDAPGDSLVVSPGGTLLGNIYLAAGTLDLQGTLSFNLIGQGGTLISDGGVLENVTLSVPLDLAAGSHVVGLASSVNIPGQTINATVDDATIGVAAATGVYAVLNYGQIVMGSPDAAAPARLQGLNGPLKLSETIVGVTGAAEFDGSISLGGASIVVAAGGTLVVAGALNELAPAAGFANTIDISSGTLDLSQATLGAPNGPFVVRMDDAAGKLVLGAQQAVTVSNFQAGDTIDIGSAAITGALVAAGNLLTVGTDQITLDTVAPGQTFFAASDGAGGTLVSTSRSVGPSTARYAITGPSAAVQPYSSGVGADLLFTVTRTGDTDGAALLHYSVAGTGATATANLDFNPADLAGTVIFKPGDTSEQIKLYTVNTSTLAADQSFGVTLSAPPGISVSAPSATGTILHSDANTLSTAEGESIVVNGNTLVSATGAILGFSDATLGTQGGVNMDYAAAGGPSYLLHQYIYAGSDSIAFATRAPSVFVHAGSGNDAVNVSSGQNVLDGGLGSNFLTGGTGADTFFTDSRSSGVVWNTLVNFHAGDAATLWGFTAGISSYRWESTVAGAPGAQGATLRANIVGGGGRTGDGVDASITFAGLSVEQGQKLEVVTGSVAAGNYLYLYNPGV